MTDHDDDVARRYRELPREEPPSALDAAILAQGRRAVAARPAGLRRWSGPLSIAAVLVLAVGIVSRMQVEQPGVETSAPARAPVVVPEAAPAPQAPAPVEKRAMRDEAPPQQTITIQSATPPPPQPFRIDERALNAQRAKIAAAAPAPAAPPASAGFAADSAATPEAELERIAKLRAEGRDEEADRALEDFRKRRPDYRIPDETWARVRPRQP